MIYVIDDEINFDFDLETALDILGIYMIIPENKAAQQEILIDIIIPLLIEENLVQVKVL